MKACTGANEASPSAPGDPVLALEPDAARGVSSNCVEEFRSDIMALLRHTVLLGFIILGCWLVFYRVWKACPQITPGSLRVYDEKLSTVQKSDLFPAEAQRRVLVVGHSYTMTGFEPLLFDKLGSNVCSAFNLGLPVTLFGRRIYSLDETLDMLERSGNAPTHVLVTWRDPWPPAESRPKPSLWNWITPKFDSAAAMQRLFPFKQIGRDGLIFLARSCAHGGPAVFREASNNEVSKMLHNRGYYFMKSDSIFPSDELPANFCARSDSPNIGMGRDIKVWEQFVSGLKRRTNGPRILLVPNYYRANSCAPALSNAELREVLGRYGIEVVGPDYFQYPNQMFSDAAHLNPKGANGYTEDLWDLLRDHLGN